MKPNGMQQVLMKEYEGGAFADLKRGEDLRNCGDSLFQFLYEELGDDCILEAKDAGVPAATLAAQRLNNASVQIQHIIGCLYAAPPTQ